MVGRFQDFAFMLRTAYRHSWMTKMCPKLSIPEIIGLAVVLLCLGTFRACVLQRWKRFFHQLSLLRSFLSFLPHPCWSYLYRHTILSRDSTFFNRTARLSSNLPTVVVAVVPYLMSPCSRRTFTNTSPFFHLSLPVHHHASTYMSHSLNGWSKKKKEKGLKGITRTPYPLFVVTDL